MSKRLISKLRQSARDEDLDLARIEAGRESTPGSFDQAINYFVSGAGKNTSLEEVPGHIREQVKAEREISNKEQ